MQVDEAGQATLAAILDGIAQRRVGYLGGHDNVGGVRRAELSTERKRSAMVEQLRNSTTTTHLKIRIDGAKPPRLTSTSHAHPRELPLGLINPPPCPPLPLPLPLRVLPLPLALIEERIQPLQPTRRNPTTQPLQAIPHAVRLGRSAKAQLVDRKVACAQDERGGGARESRRVARDGVE